MKKVVGICIIVVLVLFSGCSSLSTWVRSNLEGVPVWVYEPQVSRNQMAFVGRGNADNETRARVLAYESILVEISEFIGRDVTDQHIAELSMRNAIDEYRLRITQEFVKFEADSFTVFFLAVADSDVIQRTRSEAEVLLLEQQRQIDLLNQQASQAFRDNRDTVDLERYVQIASIAASMPVDRGERQYADAIQRIQNIVRPLNLSVTAGDPAIPTTVVTLRRGTRALSPRVAGAPIAAYSDARDGLGEVYRDKQRFVTDASGQIIYTSSNPTITGRGQITFGLDLQRTLQPLQAIDVEVYEQLVALLQNAQVHYPYQRVSLIQSQITIVALSEYTLQGERLNTDSAAARLASELGRDDMRVQIAQAPAVDDDEDLMPVLRQQFPTYAAIMYGNVGVSHVQRTSRGVAVTVTGETSFINLARGTVIGRTGTVHANAIASTEQEAQMEAFSRFGAVSASLLYRYLYR